MKTVLLLLGLCLLARSTFGGEAVASFAKQTLGLDLASVPFATTASTNGEYKIAEPPTTPPPFAVDKAVSWMTNAASAKYTQSFPNRVLRYAFRNGRLEAVRITISAFAGSDALFEQRRKELVRIQDELLKASPIQKLNFEDGGFRLQYGASCAPTPELLLVMEIQIAPTAVTKVP